ncbi:TnsA endonuclease N-terminal domain-containing protein [Bradyrhizobium valentinum]|uniref:TnsA endonuclease N-terminal domain-containing protein n=1 Tax=Bradyrhizobium valentinum TaxID=1518501 RepID=UPI000B0AB749|nr:TnsA endonuclease N-terminal domain-containing protein [Bradyrhizobium valentinum]
MRRIPLSRRSHVTGFRPIAGEAIEHESALERDFVLLSTFLDASAVITSQPITIEFRDGARLRRYTPDFRVIWSSGQSELVEVKYRVDLRAQWAQLRPGFAAARAMARENGGRFRIATERGIRGPLLDNARRLLPLRKAPLDPATSERALQAARTLCDPTFERIVDAMCCDRAMALGAVWRLIARGALKVDLAAPIHPSSPVRLA